MHQTKYLKRAKHRFLQGTRFRTPYDAVESGKRTIEDWLSILCDERETYFAQQRALADLRKPSRAPRVKRRMIDLVRISEFFPLEYKHNHS